MHNSSSDGVDDSKSIQAESPEKAQTAESRARIHIADAERTEILEDSPRIEGVLDDLSELTVVTPRQQRVVVFVDGECVDIPVIASVVDSQAGVIVDLFFDDCVCVGFADSNDSALVGQDAEVGIGSGDVVEAS